MTQVFRDDGSTVGVTALEVGPCTVTQVKTVERDGYEAAQLGFGTARKLNRPARGHLNKLGQFKYLREFRVDELPALGDVFDVGIFEVGQPVDVSAISKGRGFAGGVKRYHFAGGPKTHGQSDRHRSPGSIGAGTTPGRVWKGLHMAGHMGRKRVTVRNVTVFLADPDRRLLLVEGSVPGPVDGLVEIKTTKSAKAVAV